MIWGNAHFFVQDTKERVQIIEHKMQHEVNVFGDEGRSSMHLGKLKNEAFIKAHKQYGFSTVTQLVDFACEELKRKIAQERRAKWRQEAHTEYAKSDPRYLWESIDGGTRT